MLVWHETEDITLECTLRYYPFLIYLFRGPEEKEGEAFIVPILQVKLDNPLYQCHGHKLQQKNNSFSFSTEELDKAVILPFGFSSVSSATQLCLTLCDPMDCSTPAPRGLQPFGWWEKNGTIPSLEVASRLCIITSGKYPVWPQWSGVRSWWEESDSKMPPSISAHPGIPG